MNGLLGSAILDTAVGLIFIYLLLAVFCTAVNEWVAGLFNVRAKFLQRAIKGLLQDPNGASDLLSKFYAHPVIASITTEKKHPSYIPARAFSRAIMDLVTPATAGPLDFNALETGIKNLPPGRMRTALLSLIQDADKNFDHAQRNIEAWYDDTMDRVSGWYKRHAQIVTVCVALAITVATNADSLSMARRLWVDPAMRAVIVERSKLIQNAPPPATSQPANQPANPPPAATNPKLSDPVVSQDSQLLGNILGWSNQTETFAWPYWLEHVLGWILTIIAVSLGAPFWFDALNRFMNIRNAGKSPVEQAKVPDKPKLPPADKTV